MTANMLESFLWDPESAADEAQSVLETKRYLIFQLGEALFAVDIHTVQRVLSSPETKPIPNAPAFVHGIASVTDAIIPIICLAELFHLGGQADPEDQRLLVVDLPGQRVGMLVDSASEIVDIPADAFQPAPPMVAGISGDYILGVAEWDDRLFILLDLNRVLSVEEISALADLAD